MVNYNFKDLVPFFCCIVISGGYQVVLGSPAPWEMTSSSPVFIPGRLPRLPPHSNPKAFNHSLTMRAPWASLPTPMDLASTVKLPPQAPVGLYTGDPRPTSSPPDTHT